MKIKHYSCKNYSEMKSRIQQIISISNQNNISRTDIATYEFTVLNNPHIKQIDPDYIFSIKSQIICGEIEIEKHKKWIEKKAPGFWNRVYFVSNYITTWDFELSSIDIPYTPSVITRLSSFPKNYTEEKRSDDLKRRRHKMKAWYVFFFGDDYLKTASIPVFSEE